MTTGESTQLQYDRLWVRVPLLLPRKGFSPESLVSLSTREGFNIGIRFPPAQPCPNREKH